MTDAQNRVLRIRQHAVIYLFYFIYLFYLFFIFSFRNQEAATPITSRVRGDLVEIDW